jgi:hypothetical protein
MEDMGVKNGATFNSAIGIELENLNQPSFKRIRIELGPLIGMRQIFVLNGEFEEVSIIDCTEIGASPPIATLPTKIWRDLRRLMAR